MRSLLNPADMLIAERYHAALSRATSPANLDRLAGDTNAHVRRLVARNARTGCITLGILSRDNDQQVRVSVACNTSTPASVLADMGARDVSPVVRHYAAFNIGYEGKQA